MQIIKPAVDLGFDLDKEEDSTKNLSNEATTQLENFCVDDDFEMELDLNINFDASLVENSN